MDLLTREVLNQTIAEAIDATRNKICAEDEIFQQDEKDLDEFIQESGELFQKYKQDPFAKDLLLAVTNEIERMEKKHVKEDK